MTEKNTRSGEQVLDGEWKHIQSVKKYKEDKRGKLSGLAISGGGIRSASFGLGVIQALQAKGVLQQLDYMSTVSGGGYIGSSLTWFLHQYKQECTLDAEKFPLGDKDAGAKKSKRNTILDYIRQHGNYLTPGQGLNAASLLAVVLRSMVLGLLVYFPLLSALIYVFHQVGFFKPLQVAFPSFAILFQESLPWFAAQNSFMLLALLSAAFFLLMCLIFSFCTFCIGGNWYKPYKLRTVMQKRLGRLLVLIAAALVLGSLPHTTEIMGDLIAGSVAGGSVFLGVFGGVVKFLKLRDSLQKAEPGKINEIMPMIAALLLIYGLLLGAFLVSGTIKSTLLIGGIVSFSVLLGLIVNLNYVSLHRMYRDRLMETFLPDMKSVKSENDYQQQIKLCKAAEANTKKLSDHVFSDPEVNAPYHLINTNVILVDSANPRYRGRGGDNFILSPLFCGSDATGWCDTGTFMKGQMTLASGMAISGAAVNPHTGVAGRGVTRNNLVSFLMTMLNLRLGYWARNPGQFKLLARPDYFMPGLWMGLTGRGFNEKSYFVELSDGGHFDNTGLYELVRRRLKTIILSDGSADPDFNFADLANAIERVRVDFGVNINFNNKEEDLSHLLPGSAGDSFYKKKYNLAAKGYAIGTIEYPQGSGEPERLGIIVYIKSTLTPDLPADIYGYKSENPKFPDQSTADQFFDETQFEAYRELGYQLAKQMLSQNDSFC